MLVRPDAGWAMNLVAFGRARVALVPVPGTRCSAVRDRLSASRCPRPGDLEGARAGALVSARLGDEYAFVAMALATPGP